MSEKQNVLFDLEGWFRKVFLGMKPPDQLGLDETGITSFGESKTATPEPAKVAAPEVDRTTSQQTGSEPRPTLKTQPTRPTLSPKAVTVNPERFLQ